MGVPTYLPIATISISSPVNTVSFTNITQQYRDLILVSSLIYPTSAIQNARMTFNNDSASTSYKLNYIDGYAPGSTGTGNDNGGNFSIHYAGTTVSTNPSNSIANFMDYSVTDKHKSGIIRYNSANSGTGIYGIRYASNSPITSMQIYAQNSLSWQSGTTFTLYGVSA
jgi:hypothetical protein